MTSVEIIFAFIGSSLSGIGLFTLYRAWQKSENSKLLTSAGWALIFIGLILWAYAGGKDRGIALGAIVLILQALSFIGYQAMKDKASQKPKKSPKSRHVMTSRTPHRIYMKRLGTGLWVSLGCGILSFLAAMGLHEVFWQSGMHASNALVFALFLFPILWATLSAFSLTSHRMELKLITFTGLACLSLMIIIIPNGVI